MQKNTSFELTEGDDATKVTVRWPISGTVTADFLRDFDELLTHLEDSSARSPIIFRGLTAPTAGDRPPPPEIDHCRKWEKLIVRIDRFAAISIAVVDGPCVRFAAQLAIACDLRVFSSAAYLEMPEVREGYLPGMNTFRLAKFLGFGAANRIIVTGAKVSAEEARELRLTNEIFSPEELDGAIAELAAVVRTVPPTTAQLARRLLNESFATSFEDAIGSFIAAQNRCLSELR